MQDKSERSLGRPGQKSPRAEYDLLVTLMASQMENRMNINSGKIEIVTVKNLLENKTSH